LNSKEDQLFSSRHSRHIPKAWDCQRAGNSWGLNRQ